MKPLDALFFLALTLTACGAPFEANQLFTSDASANDAAADDGALQDEPARQDSGAEIEVGSAETSDASPEASEAVDSATPFDGCAPLPPGSPTWGTECEAKCERCASLYDCGCLAGCGGSICPVTGTFRCQKSDSGTLTANCGD